MSIGDTSSETDGVAVADTGQTSSPVAMEVPLVADNNGWIDAESNALGIQGRWYTVVVGGAPVYPLGMPVTADEQSCTWGYVCQAEETEYNPSWGGGIAFDLCTTRNASETVETWHTLADCPLSPDLSTRFLGIAFTVSGSWASDELRVVFRENGREHNAYVPIRMDATQGEYVARLDDAAVLYDPEAPPPRPENITSMYFLVPADEARDLPFNFCILDIRALVGEP